MISNQSSTDRREEVARPYDSRYGRPCYTRQHHKSIIYKLFFRFYLPFSASPEAAATGRRIRCRGLQTAVVAERETDSQTQSIAYQSHVSKKTIVMHTAQDLISLQLVLFYEY